MRRLFRAILLLYPAEYRAMFGPEMLDVFEEANTASKSRGWLASIRFANHECFGLLKGAVSERSAEWRKRNEYITFRSGSRDFENPDDIAETQQHLQHLLRSMELAIAHHDFPRARFYSNQERLTRAHLQCLLDSNKRVHPPLEA